jgi:hypothetical protein
MVDFGKVLPYLRGQNLLSPRSWKLRVLDALHKTPTIQLKYKVEVYCLTPEDKAEFDRLNAEGRVDEANILLFTKGTLKSTTGEKKAHSFVLQFLQEIEAITAHAYSAAGDAVLIKDYGGTPNRSVAAGTPASSIWFATEAPSTNALYGILVGIGATAPVTTDWTIEQLTAHGSGATQLNYNACSVGAASVVGANVDLTIIRTFNNGSGGTITLKEIGIVTATQYGGSTQGYFLTAHDAVNQAILNTEVAVVSYTMRTTV